MIARGSIAQGWPVERAVLMVCLLMEQHRRGSLADDVRGFDIAAAARSLFGSEQKPRRMMDVLSRLRDRKWLGYLGDDPHDAAITLTDEGRALARESLIEMAQPERGS